MIVHLLWRPIWKSRVKVKTTLKNIFRGTCASVPHTRTRDNKRQKSYGEWVEVFRISSLFLTELSAQCERNQDEYNQRPGGCPPVKVSFQDKTHLSKLRQYRFPLAKIECSLVKDNVIFQYKISIRILVFGLKDTVSVVIFFGGCGSEVFFAVLGLKSSLFSLVQQIVKI